MIAIVDYGMGNLGSVLNMLKRLSIEAQITGVPEQVIKADKIILPGVGAFDAAMDKINASGLKDALEEQALKRKVPFLGICLGMQLLTNNSEEGKMSGLSWIKAETKKFDAKKLNVKVPHMGWNIVTPQGDHQLFKDMADELRFYFVHSYYVKLADNTNCLLKAVHGQEFDAGITNGDNIFGVQFHPEKSHKFGMKLLENFSGL